MKKLILFFMFILSVAASAQDFLAVGDTVGYIGPVGDYHIFHGKILKIYNDQTAKVDFNGVQESLCWGNGAPIEYTDFQPRIPLSELYKSVNSKNSVKVNSKMVFRDQCNKSGECLNEYDVIVQKIYVNSSGHDMATIKFESGYVETYDLAYLSKKSED